jgi:hypothetical protein
MASTEQVQAFEARLAVYRLDDRARRLMREIWPLIEPNLEAAIDQVLAAVGKLPLLAETVARNKDALKELQLAHFKALLGGNLDANYVQSCVHMVEQETALGLDARIRSSGGTHLLRVALDALARKYRFRSAKVAEGGTRAAAS